MEKSKYEQSLETVRHFIAVAEKELELYYRHIALYGISNKQTCSTIAQNSIEDSNDTVNRHFTKSKILESTLYSTCDPQMDYDSSDQELNGTGNVSSSETELDGYCMSDDEDDLDSEGREEALPKLT